MILDLMAGVEEFEIAVHRALFEAVAPFEQRARARGRRRTAEEQKASIREPAKLGDEQHVLEGLRVTLD